MAGRRQRAFTLIEILVSLAIFVILIGLMFRPMLTALELLSIGSGEQKAQAVSRTVINQLTEELQGALWVYSNLEAFDLATGANADSTARWRTAQTARIDLVLPARDANGQLLTPLRAATAPGDASKPQVVTYWRMRSDPTKPYDPELNPFRLYRAVHVYDAVTNPDSANLPDPIPVTPDKLWSYALQVAEAGGESLATIGDNLTPLFAKTGPFDWFVTNVDRIDPVDTDTGRIMAYPVIGAPINNAATMAGLTTVTEPEVDLRTLEALPTLIDGEELQPNEDRTAYRGSLARWTRPYQRASDGQWTLPSADLVPRTVSGNSAPLPAVARFRARGARSALLGTEYFLTIEQDASSSRVGHPLLYRQQADSSANPVLVYDLTEYPRRTFPRQPEAEPSTGGPSGEFACGIDWERGELVTAFPQRDVICPAATPSSGRIHALNNFSLTAAAGDPPLYGSGSTSASAEWQSLPLTYRHTDNASTPNLVEEVGVNGAMLDDYVLDSYGASQTAGVWNSYTLSVLRPQRLKTGTDEIQPADASQADRTLNMSIVPGSEQVVVLQYQVPDLGSINLTGATPLTRRTYTPLRTLGTGAINAGDLAPYRYYLDPATGELTFYDPQLDQDNTDANRRVRDGLNPPAVIPTADGTEWLVPVIYVTYRYRNNLPTVDRVQFGDDSSRDVVEATYRSLESLDLRLVLDVSTTSTRGDTEVIKNTLDPGDPGFERPTGARRRVTVQTVLVVGSAL